MNTISISYENKKQSASGELEKELMAAVIRILGDYEVECNSIQFATGSENLPKPQREIRLFGFMS